MPEVKLIFNAQVVLQAEDTVDLVPSQHHRRERDDEASDVEYFTVNSLWLFLQLPPQLLKITIMNQDAGHGKETSRNFLLKREKNGQKNPSQLKKKKKKQRTVRAE